MKNKISIGILTFLLMSNISFSISVLNFDSILGGDGTGKFVNAKGGTMGNQDDKPFDEAKGKIWIDGDWAENNGADVITGQTAIFHAKDTSNLVAASDSPFFRADIAKIGTDGWTAKLTRVNIVDINNYSNHFILDSDKIKYTVSNNPYQEIKGDIWLSSSLFDENEKTDILFYTSNFSGKLHLNSSLFYKGLQEKDNNGHYYAIANRVKFTDGIVENQEIAKFLESNYSVTSTNSQKKFYKQIKTISTEKELNLTLNEVFGYKKFPAITKQTFDKVGSLNITGLNFVSTFDISKEVGDVVVDGNYGNTKTKVKNKESNNDYTTSDTNMVFSVEKYTSPNLKIGTVFNFSNGSTSMKEDNTYRDDYYGTGGVYAVYDQNSVIYTSILSLGGNYSKLYRYNNSPVADFNSNSTNKNYFAGLNNSVYREFDIKKSYITPKAELNIIGLHQGEIVEGGHYGLDIEAENTVSVQPGVGVEIGHGFDPTPSHRISISAGVMNYIEVGEPYKDLTASINAFDNKYKIKKYDDDLVHSEISLNEGYEYLDIFGLYLSEKYTVAKSQTQFEYGLNVAYRF